MTSVSDEQEEKPDVEMTSTDEGIANRQRVVQESNPSISFT
jgi:hypothetical protein